MLYHNSWVTDAGSSLKMNERDAPFAAEFAVHSIPKHPGVFAIAVEFTPFFEVVGNGESSHVVLNLILFLSCYMNAFWCFRLEAFVIAIARRTIRRPFRER